jgi:T5SS/PEP-CTERM-associated repeat protein
MIQARMTTQLTWCVLFSILIIVILWPNLSTAAIIPSGDVSPTYPGSIDPWRIDLEPVFDDLIVGDTTDGSIEINNGYWVQSTSGYIGKNPTATGLVTVTGKSTLESRWYNNDSLYVGYSGTGVMEISDEGHVTSSVGSIGTMSGSSGSVTVDGLNSLWESTEIYIGGSEEAPGGTGLLNIINDGTVEADSVVIWSTGTLSGDSTLVSGSVSNFGTIKPGNSIGTLTIDGDLTMQPGSIYEVEVDNSGNSDLLSVTGNVNIVGGKIKTVSTETVTGLKQYTIIQAGNVTGSFDAVDTALIDCSILVSDDVSLDYGTDSVLLQIQVRPFDDPSIVRTDNQLAVARAFQQIAEVGDNSITTALQSLESIGQVRSAYDQLCGQTRLNLTPVTAVDTSKFMDTVSDRLNYVNQGLAYYGSGSGPLLAMAEPDKSNPYSRMYYTTPYFDIGNDKRNFGNEEWDFWGKGYGALGDREAEGGVAGYQYSIYGTSFGLDCQVNDNALMGLTAGYSMSHIDSSIAGDESDIYNTHIGIYGSQYADYWHLDSIFTYSFLKYETERFVNIMGEKLKGDSNGQGISGYVEARYDWGNIDHWILQPLASFQFSYLALDSYTESGGASSLGYDDQSYNSYKGSLGIKLTQELFNRDRSYRESIQLRGRWIHEFGDDNSSLDAHFASDPGVVFKVSDEDIDRDSAVLGASFNTDLSRYTQLSFGYDVYLNHDNNMHLLSAMFVYRW